MPTNLRHTTLIPAVCNTYPITEAQEEADLFQHQNPDSLSPPIIMVIVKRDSHPTPTNIQNDWAIFDQFRVVLRHIVDSTSIGVQAPSSPPTQSTLIPPSIPIILDQEIIIDQLDKEGDGDNYQEEPSKLSTVSI